MTTITHHPDSSTLMSFAAGALPEALSAVVAAHAMLCEGCRHELRLMNRLGGAVISEGPEAHLSDRYADAVATSGEMSDGQDELAARARAEDSDSALAAATVTRILANDFSDVRWRRLGFGVWHMPLALSAKRGGDLRLIKVAPGVAMPEHGHGGPELSLILSGRYTDGVGTFAAGDVEDVDGDMEHMPVADARDGCICLIASERPAKFKGLFARMAQPFIGI